MTWSDRKFNALQYYRFIPYPKLRYYKEKSMEDMLEKTAELLELALRVIELLEMFMFLAT